jgi:hypothetical protein
MQILFVLLALLPAVLFSQAPELVQQYRQRLGGAANELATVVRNFEEDSHRSGYTQQGALDLMGRNSEQLVRDQAERMRGYIDRLQRLRQQQAALGSGVTLTSLITVAREYDAPLMDQTWNDFVPAIPTTFLGLTTALLGWIAGYLVLFLTTLARRLTQRRRIYG